MYQEKMIWIGKASDEKVYIRPAMANRHGLIAGATGTGKTTTLRVMAESFSDAGVPVFLADIKGDVAAMCKPGSDSGFVGTRMQEWNLAEEGFELHGCPVAFWDVYGEKGLPLRTTVTEMGPILMAQVLNLNATQESVLEVVFKIADDEGMLLIDTKDLIAMISYIGEDKARKQEYELHYGHMANASLTAIVRAIVALNGEGGEQFFAEPAIKITDWIRRTEDGQGMVNILDCQKLSLQPRMYSTFMLWMLSELYETLPEVGDMPKPRMVFFFDEAHMLFDNASKELLDKIEQVVKLIRSKGVGIYFITQNPADVPDGILAQLNNKIQHGLRAYTPAEQKKLKSAAMSLRANPDFDTVDALQNLGTGEALVSVLDEKGIPTVTQRCVVLPPQSGMGPITDEERATLIQQDDLFFKYDESIDRDSAYEFLQRRSAADAEAARAAAEAEAARKQAEREAAAAEKARQKAELAAQRQAEKEAAAAQRQAEKEAEAAARAAAKEEEARKKKATRVAKSVASTAGGTVGREVGKSLGKSVGGSFGKTLGGNLGASLGRGILGSLFGK